MKKSVHEMSEVLARNVEAPRERESGNCHWSMSHEGEANWVLPAAHCVVAKSLVDPGCAAGFEHTVKKQRRSMQAAQET